ncbi:MAG: TonB-dependent receptor plug domain-containing protein, partial [Robiginitomaculum sp.]|nr:TonB-dependent receptor plug domain-containing protein [Robiginitomaculum sp.]
MSITSKTTLAFSTSILALALALPALAQVEDEIIVTATKRSETIFDVPLAVTAVSGDTLAKAQIRDIADLQNIAPSLTFSQTTGGLQSIFSIRGIGTAGNNTGLEQSVG